MMNIIHRNGPDFIGIGVQRSGTSWLFECLKEHEGVFLPQKEVHFFNNKYERGVDWYESLFKIDEQDKARGEITPDYLFNKYSIERIAQHYPSIKLIIILRDPFDRAYSAYNLFKAHGRFKDMSFEEAIKKDKWILEQSLYSSQLERVFSLFPEEHVKIYDFEDISYRPLWLLRDVFEFIGVDANFQPSRFKERYNVSGFSAIQDKFDLPRIQKAMNQNKVGKQLLKLKRLSLVRQLKSWLLDRNHEENLKDLHCSLATRQIIKADLLKVSNMLNKSYEKWY
jgi:hypothetical protein